MMMKRLKRWWRGFDASDMTMLEMKIAAGLRPREANLNKYETSALVSITRERLIELCERYTKD